jgi:hypothetical protein
MAAVYGRVAAAESRRAYFAAARSG